MKASRVVWLGVKLRKEPLWGKLWGKKHGRFATINISKYEHFTSKTIRTYSHLVCPSWFPVFSTVLSLFCRHCYSCSPHTESHNVWRLHELIVCVFSKRELGIPVVLSTLQWLAVLGVLYLCNCSRKVSCSNRPSGRGWRDLWDGVKGYPPLQPPPPPPPLPPLTHHETSIFHIFPDSISRFPISFLLVF